MDLIRFGQFVLDPRARLLLRDGEPVHLTTKGLDLLLLLAHRRPHAVGKKELHQQLWPSTFVSEVSLTTLVFEVRAALGESARQPRFVRTVHGFGYAFQVGAASATERSAETQYRIYVEHREIMLRLGENVIGRSRDCVVRLDSARVSRHHARITIEDDGAMIEDCGSRNGSMVRGKPTEGRVRLNDGDDIDIAGTRLVFRAEAATQGTETD